MNKAAPAAKKAAPAAQPAAAQFFNPPMPKSSIDFGSDLDWAELHGQLSRNPDFLKPTPFVDDSILPEKATTPKMIRM
eukprot:NODE_6470_length_357_cov_41.113636_g5747_i0.p1 GENE.NODE_6470_length_357_cov_41.113636_g5747_i0~~NODE_6470_length_357_cov_41.113636_g5747_i0.p1  ORF type:complete len:78 (+),score=16.35 NODE_6470_length_357_cov_41.113636_g5747_i0:53-286(+)